MRELEIKDYIQIVRKRIWLVVSLVVIVTLLAGVYSLYVAKPVYEASTKIIVSRTDSTNDSKQLNSDEVNTNIRLIDTYKEIIKTPAIMDKVIVQHSEFQLTTDELIEKVGVSSVNDTQVMTVVVRDQSYQKAAQIVNAVSETFRNEIPGLMSVQNVSILNYAKEDKADVSPVSPNVILNCMIAFILGLISGIGIALLLEFMDDTLKTEKEIQELLGVPTLASIHRLSAEDIKTEKQVVEKSNHHEVSKISSITKESRGTGA